MKIQIIVVVKHLKLMSASMITLSKMEAQDEIERLEKVL